MLLSLILTLLASPVTAQKSAPLVSFSAQDTSGVAPLEVRFHDESRGALTSWSWDFGDGSTSSERHPLHVYEAPGVYTVALRATGPRGAGGTTRESLVVVGPQPLDDRKQPRPNVLLVVLDDVGVDRLGAYGEAPPGATTPCTPNLDQLAAEGLLFRRCYANPLCSPTRATILTGRHGFRTGIGNLVDAGGLRTGLSASLERTLPEALWRYDSSLVGKWHLGHPGNDGLLHPLDSGFRWFSGSMFNLSVQPVDFGSGPLDCSPFGAVGYYNWVKTTTVAPGVLAQSCSNVYATTDTVDDAIQRALAMRGPWFLQVNLNAAHLPPELPPLALCPTPGTCAVEYCQLPTPSTGEALDAIVEASDRELGRLFSAVRAVDPDTYIFVISDNGSESVAARGASGSCFGPDRSKGTLFEGGIRVPLIVAGPGIAPGECTNLVQSTDLFATIAALTHSRASAEDSISFRPYLFGQLRPRRAFAYAEIFSPNFISPDKAPPFLPNSHLRAVTDGRFKLIRYSDKNGLVEEFLIDLENDPCEQVDLSPGFGPADPQALTSEQRDRFLALRGELQRLGVY